RARGWRDDGRADEPGRVNEASAAAAATAATRERCIVLAGLAGGERQRAAPTVAARSGLTTAQRHGGGRGRLVATRPSGPTASPPATTATVGPQPRAGAVHSGHLRVDDDHAARATATAAALLRARAAASAATGGIDRGIDLNPRGDEGDRAAAVAAAGRHGVE